MADGYIPLTVENMKTQGGIALLNQMLSTLFLNVPGDGNTVKVFSGYGTPENSVVAGIGSIYQRKDGGANTSIYVKESGTGATGWVAK